MDRGQPVLLPPGLHQWDSPTVEFQRLIDLASSVICLGPYTLITVDEGYAAVTQDNGEQKILEGGRAYMLTHRKVVGNGGVSRAMSYQMAPAPRDSSGFLHFHVWKLQDW